jgi:nuclear GTP-binding protein
MSRIYLIDCPGVVPPHTDDTETDVILKSVIRISNIKDPADHIPAVLERVKKEYLVKTYGIRSWTDHEDFLGQLAKKTGRLLKGGDPDLNTVAKMMLFDWQRGKIPFFVAPPFEDNGQPV